MLVNFISPEKLPWIIVWVDWNLYAYKLSLVVFVALFIGRYWSCHTHHSYSGVGLSMFIGFCAWCVWCSVKHGYAVG